MPNGAIIEELRRLAATPQAISTSSALRLMLSAQAEMGETIRGMRDEQIAYRAERQDVEQTRDDKLEMLCADVAILKISLDNPMVEIGGLIKKHPKLTVTLISITGIALLVVSSLWLEDSIRYAILAALGIPTEIVNLVIKATQTPIP